MKAQKESPEMVTKEISKGIFLHKQQHIRDDTEPPEIVYIFKVEVQALQVVDFTTDFSESKNVMLENHRDLIATTTIQPFTSEVVAVLRLFSNWKLKSKFRFTMHSPPIAVQEKYLAQNFDNIRKEIETSVEQFSSIPSEVIATPELNEIISKSGIRFLDPDFLPVETALYGSQGSPFDTLFVWKRPEEFISPDPETGTTEICLYSPVIEVNEITEGVLGDSWFASAVATLAEVPPLIDRLFLTKEINKEGVYRVKICKNGEWHVVTVDDLMPCTYDNGPIFCKSAANEIWLMLLEKAYAKLHGNYLLLRGGYAHEALIDLTGCPCTFYHFADEFIQDMIKTGALWKKILDAEEKGYLMSASTAGEKRWEETPTADTEENALLLGHSYTIMTAAECMGNKLLKIKNIWGQFEWTGDWSASSPLWTPELRKELGLFKDEGIVNRKKKRIKTY